MSQELPQGSELSVSLFPKSIERLTHRIQKKSNKKKLQFCFDVLQCKSLANEVPRDMIVDAYHKHAQQLSNPITPPKQEVLDQFREFIMPFINLLPDVLPSTKLAQKKAYLGFSRKRGGLHEALRPSINQFDYKVLRPRLETSCLHLEGPPGSGKSLLFAKLGKRFDKYFDTENSVFWKSSTSDHYDGYNQQPVMGIDDCFYQNFDSKLDHSKTEELLQIASTVDFQPPMAEIKNKGMRFVSPILLLSSNKGNTYLRMLGSVNNQEAFLRRLDLNFFIHKDKKSGKYNLTRYGPMSEPLVNYSQKNCEVTYRQYDCNERGVNQLWTQSMSLNEVEEYLFRELIQLYEAKRDFYLDEFSPFEPVFRQTINGTNKFYEFPKEPTSDIRIVEAYAIPEPLKVRMITKGHPHTWALKPVQIAMFNTLRNFKIFDPCMGPDYKKIYSSEDGEILVSGDYSAATDGICQELTKIVGDLVKDKYPHLGSYIHCGTREHIVTYPKGANQHDILQTGGQLMGSLLSFPILCLVNAFSLAHVRGQELDQLDCLIHGDDISFAGSQAEIDQWKQFASSLGLEPSVGKNYTSPDWYTIDSKLFRKGECLPNLKWKQLQEPGPEEISNIIGAIGIKGATKFCGESLRKTVRSLEVDILYGGLNPNGRQPETRLEKILYIGRSLDRLPVFTKGHLTLRDLDVDPDMTVIQREIDVFEETQNEPTERWYTEKKWLMLFNKFEEKLPESRFSDLCYERVKHGSKVDVEYCPFMEHLVSAKIFNRLFNKEIDEQIDNGFVSRKIRERTVEICN
jgi:hypothetical protein